MAWENITFYQLALLWLSCVAIVLIGAMIKGGGRLLISYLPIGLLLGPVALIRLIFERRKACPFCHQVLKPNFKTCPHCDHRLVYTEQ